MIVGFALSGFILKECVMMMCLFGVLAVFGCLELRICLSDYLFELWC